ncbi:MAG: hypothetical protein J5750_07650 [Clostridiales bacterium]|nr:hypothetical protein [Clostridiales bacterium]
MKRWFSQVNRGLVLLLVVILGVAVYIVLATLKTNKQRSVLRELAIQYTSDSAILYTFPQDVDYHDRSAMTRDALLPVLYKKAEPVYHYFCNNTAVQNAQVDATYNYLYISCMSEQVPVSCTRTVTSVEIDEVYRGSATVLVYSNTVIEYQDMEGKRSTHESQVQDTLLFVYQDGEWKIANVNCDLIQMYDHY